MSLTTYQIMEPLYKRTSTGKIQTWQIAVEPYPHGHHDHMELDPCDIVTTYGLLDGKQQVARETISEGKNLGKVNETTPYQQAQLEAQSQWEQKVKKGYVHNIEDAEEKKIDATYISGGVEPMLAHDYSKQGHKINYPAYAQPKLDGHRCIAIYQDGKCTLWSRTRKRITGVPHIARQIEAMFTSMNAPGPCVLDGELYNHDYRDNFQELTSFIRQETPKPGHEVVEYWIYDIVDPVEFISRTDALSKMSLYAMPSIVFVPTENVDDEGEMIAVFGAYIENGFEGLMLRNKRSNYKHGRSSDLQKVKTFDDAEFTVTAVETGKGKMADKAMFVCDAGNGQTFRVKMVGELDSLKEYLVEPERWIGQQLTVKFQGKSNEGIPRFPIALRFREEV